MSDTAAEGLQPESSSPGAGLGPRLRRVRTEQKLSVRELARRAGCSASLVSQIERGVTAPSAGVLYALANQLSISLDYLFGKDDTVPAPVSVIPLGVAASETGRAIVRPDGDAERPTWGRATGPDGIGILQRSHDRNAINLSSGVRWERLTPAQDQRVDFLEVVYAPFGKSSEDDGYVRHDGREYLLVTTGELIADVGFESYQLAAGDSLAFDPTTPHRYRNPTEYEVRCVSIVVHSAT